MVDDVAVVDVLKFNVVDVDFVEVDVMMAGGEEEDVAEGVDEDYLMNNLDRFDTYHRLDLDHRS